MTSLRFRRLSLLAVMLLTGCTANQRAATAPGSAADLRKAWQDAFNRADTTALAALYAEDAVLLPPGGTMLTGGRSAVRQTVGRLIEDRTLRLSSVHQRARNGLGHVQGTWQAQARNGRGGPGSGRYLMLFQQEADGHWRIVYHVWTQDAEPAPERESLQP